MRASEKADHGHAGSLSRRHADHRVLDDDTVIGRCTHLLRGMEIDIRRGLALRDMLGAEQARREGRGEAGGGKAAFHPRLRTVRRHAPGHGIEPRQDVGQASNRLQRHDKFSEYQRFELMRETLRKGNVMRGSG